MMLKNKVKYASLGIVIIMFCVPGVAIAKDGGKSKGQTANTASAPKQNPATLLSMRKAEKEHRRRHRRGHGHDQDDEHDDDDDDDRPKSP